jgi:acetolactate synthase-1/2/3 large subunit
MNVAQLTVEKMKHFGVARIYGLIGTSILDLVDAIADSGIRYVSTRHDQAAVSMACAEGKVTGKPGVAIIHGGPGFLNSLTAVAVAYKDSIPSVVISGAVKRRLKGLDSWLEVNQIEMVKNIAKGSFSIQRPNDTERIISDAYSLASTPPHGPVFIEVPEDVWHLDCGELKDSSTRNHKRNLPSQEDIRKVADLIRKSKSPIILAGGGINNEEGSELLIRLVERLGIPVATTGNGRGAIPEDHQLCLGRAGYGGGNTIADNLLEKADFVLSLGAGLSDVTTYSYNLMPKGEIAAITLDGFAGNRPVPYALISNSDATLFLKMLLEVEVKCSLDSGWQREIQSQRFKWNELLDDISSRKISGSINPSRFFRILDSKLPQDVIISAGQGLHVLYAYAYLKIRKNSSFLAATNLGAMGYAFPAALGAKISLPQREVIAVLGDGEFLMTLPDLETGVRERVGVKIVIVNDNSYRVLYMRQKIQKMGRVFGTTHSNPDITRLAEAYGIEAMVLSEESKTDEAVSFLVEHRDKPCLLELKVDSEDLPPFNLEASLKF